MNLDALLTTMRQRLASDLHLREGRPPLMRVGGDLLATEHPPLDSHTLWSLVAPALNETLVKKLEDEREVDIDYEVSGVARFRLNIFYSKARIGAVIRLIPLEVPTIEMLGLPPVLKDLSSKPNGLYLVTGPTGSGKSTTLAACVEHINQSRHCHIITIEDPIEFVYQDKRATITQRALGRDSLNNKRALRSALRQDPDVILAGEMRDRETIELAIHAAETGHLVLSTLHTNDAKQTIDRILDAFSAEAQIGVRRVLAMTLVGVVCQRLIKRASGRGRVPVLEILVSTPAIKELIEKGDTTGIGRVMASSQAYWRMQTFNQSLAQLVQDRLIHQDEAMKASSSPDDLSLLLRGLGRGNKSNANFYSEEGEGAAAAEQQNQPAQQQGQVKRDGQQGMMMTGRFGKAAQRRRDR
jgi:twitching motility protein PilT